jgi:hypothetical protein
MAEGGELIQAIPGMPADAVAAVARLEAEILKLPQVEIETHHAFHGGMYARTIMIPAGVVLTGALIKIPTILVISGEALVHTSTGPLEVRGYHVLLGGAGRKQAFVAKTDTYLTMVFPCSATTVEEAEAEFTDEADRLFSRRSDAVNTVTREE